LKADSQKNTGCSGNGIEKLGGQSEMIRNFGKALEILRHNVTGERRPYTFSWVAQPCLDFALVSAKDQPGTNDLSGVAHDQ
jgi:hypothetical protein